MPGLVQGQPVLRRGSKGAEVGNLQRFLNSVDETDHEGKSLLVDEDLGPRTDHAIRSFQKTSGLRVDGIVGPETRRVLNLLGFIPFLPAKHARLVWPGKRSPNLVILHTAECLETNLNAAEDIAIWFAGKNLRYPLERTVSAHYTVDRDSIVQCVRNTDIAWHANQANDRSIGIELAGYARQNASEWDDEPSREILWRSAKLCEAIVQEHGIPARRLSPEELRRGEPGFAGHVDVTKAYSISGGHWDPGPAFPWEGFLGMINTGT